MSGREISDIDGKAEEQVTVSSKLVSMHYPKPVYLSQVLEEVAKWSDYKFVLDPSIDRLLQIFAPHRIPESQAFELLVASLESISMRIIELEGSIMKVVIEKKKTIAV